MKTLKFATARVFKPLLKAGRYSGVYGGRGSGKSHFLAEKLIEDCMAEPGESGEGMRSVCIREVQKDLAQSSKLLLETKLKAYELGEASGFKVFRDVIQTPGDGLMIFKGMNDYTSESIKSLEGFKRAWWEEAQSATGHSLNLLRPTMRAPGSQLWFSWNPRRKTDSVDVMLRGVEIPTGTTLVRANWKDNPWFTAELEQERLDCLRMQPEQYGHIWDGDYVSIIEGAYYAKSLAEAKAAGRIGRVSPDPLMTLRVFCDIGGTGARADAFALWVAQFIGLEIRVLDYYEAVGQPLATHVAWMRSKGYTPDRAQIWLPHDGETHDKVHDVSYASAMKEAGYTVTVIPNQGKGAAMARVQEGRRLFPSMWFNEDATEAGRAALGWYHEKKDEARGIGLGPEHDWCLARDTQILTPDGWRGVQDICMHDLVVTPIGRRRILRSGIVRETSRWMNINGIRCTPEHRFFTSRGLVEAGELSKLERFWTRDSWGLRILAFWSAILFSGLKTAITLATPRGQKESAVPCSFIGWCMRLSTARSRQRTKSTMLTTTLSTIIRTILPRSLALSTAASTSQNPAINAYAGCVAKSLAATNNLGLDAVPIANAKIARELREKLEPAYNLTVEADECYFVKGEDGKAYLVSNSSHGADAFGLMAVAHEAPKAPQKMPKILRRFVV